MRHSIKTGLSFGLTSGVITVLGLLVGLHSGTGSKAVVMSGILIIAIADALSDAFGIHMAEESENVHSQKEIWESTFSAFISKLVVSLTFIVPFFIFSLSGAVIVSIVWGLLLLGVFSFMMAQRQGENPIKVTIEHVVMAIIVVIITHYLGSWINSINW